MANYISSNANRFYVARETSYGQPVVIAATNRFPAAKLQAHQLIEPSRRVDKTGTRSFLGAPKEGRRQTAFEVHTYLTSWNGVGEPSYGPLFQAALGGCGQLNGGLALAGVQSGTQLQTTTAHGLSFGSAISFSSDIRFITSIPDAFTLVLNAPFTNIPAPNAVLSQAVTYSLSTSLPSVTLYDYWDPASAVSRIATGAAVDTFLLSVHGDLNEFAFSGPAADLLDSSSFSGATAGLTSFPVEPALTEFDYSIVSGHLGEVWLGSTPNQFFTLTEASVEVKNNINVRNHEFGSSYPTAIVPGMREVACNFTLLAQDDAQTTALYAAAKQRTLISAMLQLGQQQGQLMGIFLPAVMPEIPNYNDSETRLQWEFKNNFAQGTSNNEIYIAFA